MGIGEIMLNFHCVGKRRVMIEMLIKCARGAAMMKEAFLYKIEGIPSLPQALLLYTLHKRLKTLSTEITGNHTSLESSAVKTASGRVCCEEEKEELIDSIASFKEVN